MLESFIAARVGMGDFSRLPAVHGHGSANFTAHAVPLLLLLWAGAGAVAAKPASAGGTTSYWRPYKQTGICRKSGPVAPQAASSRSKRPSSASDRLLAGLLAMRNAPDLSGARRAGSSAAADRGRLVAERHRSPGALPPPALVGAGCGPAEPVAGRAQSRLSQAAALHLPDAARVHWLLLQLCDLAGGGVYVLEEPGRSLQLRDLVAGRLPRGAYATLALSYDGRQRCTSPLPKCGPVQRPHALGIDWTHAATGRAGAARS